MKYRQICTRVSGMWTGRWTRDSEFIISGNHGRKTDSLTLVEIIIKLKIYKLLNRLPAFIIIYLKLYFIRVPRTPCPRTGDTYTVTKAGSVNDCEVQLNSVFFQTDGLFFDFQSFLHPLWWTWIFLKILVIERYFWPWAINWVRGRDGRWIYTAPYGNGPIGKTHPSLYKFRLFSENDNFDDGHLHERITKSYIGRIHKNLEFHPSYIFLIFPQKWQFRLKNEIFEMSRNSA